MGILRCVGNAVSFLDVLSAVPPFPSRARKSKPAERRDRSQSRVTSQASTLLLYQLGVRRDGDDFNFQYVSRKSDESPTRTRRCYNSLLSQF
jgi:hypothetical protein